MKSNVTSIVYIYPTSTPTHKANRSNGLFVWKPSWPGKRDSPVSEISLCSYFYSKNYCAFIWTRGLAWLPRFSLERGEISSNQCQNNKIVPASGMKFSHKNTREIHPAYRAVSLTGPARLPYKQALREWWHSPLPGTHLQ
jgi:hypothetical protein